MIPGGPTLVRRAHGLALAATLLLLAPPVWAAEDWTPTAQPCIPLSVNPGFGLGRTIRLCGEVGHHEGPSTLPQVEERACALPEGDGLLLTFGDGHLWLCLSYDEDMDPLFFFPIDPGLETDGCPDDMDGFEVRRGEAHVTICATTELVPPSGIGPTSWDLSPCTQGAFDPAVFIGDGGFSFCVVVQVWPPHGLPGPVDQPDIDLTPCSDGFDPKVEWMGVNFAFCVEAAVQPPSGLAFDSAEAACDRGVGFNTTLAGQILWSCVGLSA